MYLDSSVLSDNDNLVIRGCKLVKDEHPDKIKRGGVCAYIRESSPVRCLFNTYLKQYFILEVRVSKKKRYVISLYSSPSHATDEFDLFMLNLETLLLNISNRNPILSRSLVVSMRNPEIALLMTPQPQKELI